MQYRTGTISLTQGTNTVYGTGTSWLSEVTKGDGFMVRNGTVMYTVQSVVSDTELTLTTTYTNPSVTGVEYVIFRDFTSPDGIPELNTGDLESAAIFTRAMRRIQELAIGESIAGAGYFKTTYLLVVRREPRVLSLGPKQSLQGNTITYSVTPSTNAVVEENMCTFTYFEKGVYGLTVKVQCGDRSVTYPVYLTVVGETEQLQDVIKNVQIDGAL